MTTLILTGYDFQAELQRADSPMQKLAAYVRRLSYHKELFLDWVREMTTQQAFIEELKKKLDLEEAYEFEQRLDLMQRAPQAVETAPTISPQVLAKFADLTKQTEAIMANIVQAQQTIVAAKTTMLQDVQQITAQVLQAHAPANTTAQQAQAVVASTVELVEERFDKMVRKATQMALPLLTPAPGTTHAQQKAEQEQKEQDMEFYRQRKNLKLVEMVIQLFQNHHIPRERCEHFEQRFHQCINHGSSIAFERSLFMLAQSRELQANLGLLGNLIKQHGNQLNYNPNNRLRPNLQL